MQLPADLRAKIEALLSADNRQILANAADSVSRKYRRLENGSLQIASDTEARAYLATRFPATWCAVTEALNRLKEINPDFNPTTSLDLGAGPGTASIAAQYHWPELEPSMLEPNASLRAIGQVIAGGEWQTARVENYAFDKEYDLVIASYVFNEVEGDLSSILQKIWEKSSVFVMIEPGTKQGYATILKARDYFLSIGANIIAPCPHHFECPLKNSERWCHFSVRVDRSRLHRDIKRDATLSYEDEKFSYLIVSKQPTHKPLYRALGNPHGNKVISLETCRADGSFEIVSVSKRSNDYKLIKKSEWGDAPFEREE